MSRPACCVHCGTDCPYGTNRALHTSPGGIAFWGHGSCPVCVYAAAVEDLYRRRVVGSIFGDAGLVAEGVGLALDVLTGEA